MAGAGGLNLGRGNKPHSSMSEDLAYIANLHIKSVRIGRTHSLFQILFRYMKSHIRWVMDIFLWMRNQVT